MLGAGAIRAAAKLWYIKTYAGNADVPVPRDAQRLTSGQPDADRVLLIGNGPTHGWGTVTHELALTGQLARAVTRRTGRAADIEYVGDETMNLAAVIPWLGARPLADVDLVVLVLSMNDAVRLTPVETYRDDMERLLEKLARETGPDARVVVAGIHPVRSFPSYTGLFGALGQRNADRLNAAVRELIGRFDAVEFLELGAPDPEAGRPYGSPRMYEAWAEMFADPCARALDLTRHADPAVRPVALDAGRTWDWQPGAHIIDGAPEGGWDQLEQLVGDAKHRFGVDLAFVSLVDGDRQYYAATTGPSPQWVPLDVTHCKVTAKGTEPLIVRNSFKDERFKDSPLIDLTQMTFYAGVPLTDAEGETVGTFCVMSALPKSARAVPESALLEYAAQAQAELRRLAEEAPASPRDTDSLEGFGSIR